MKKSIFLMAGLVGLALTSCKEDNSLGTMQKNEAPVIVPAKGVAVQCLYNTAGSNAINLQNFEETKMISLVDIELASEFVDAMKVTGQVEVADNPDFTNPVTIALESVEASGHNSTLVAALNNIETNHYQGAVSLVEWNDAFVNFYGYNPATNVNYLRYRLWLSDGDQSIILYDDNQSVWYAPMQFEVTPLNANFDVAPAYTLFYTDGTQTYQVPMLHNDNMHQYDDPVFSAFVEVTQNPDETANPIEWWVAPSDNLDRTYGVVASTEVGATSGDMAEMSRGAKKGVIDIASVYQIEVNMLELTYNLKIAPNSLYVMFQGGDFSKVGQLSTTDYVNYEGLAGMTNKWVLTGQANYRPTLYVGNPSVAESTVNGVTTGGLMFSTDGATAATNNGISFGGRAGLFYITADLVTLQYSLYPCSTVGVVGTPNNWGNPNDDESVIKDTELKGSRTTLYMEWNGTIDLKAGDQWKIRANNEWVVDFGGAVANLQLDNGDEVTEISADGTPIVLSKGGKNLYVAEDGTYDVKVNFKRAYENGAMTPYTLTVIKK